MNIVFIGDNLSVQINNTEFELLSLIREICVTGSIPEDTIGITQERKEMPEKDINEETILTTISESQEYPILLARRLRNQDGCIICFDANRHDTIRSIDTWITRVKEHSPNVAITLLGITQKELGKLNLCDEAFDALLLATKANHAKLIITSIQDVDTIKNSVTKNVETINNNRQELRTNTKNKIFIKKLISFFKPSIQEVKSDLNPFFDDFIPSRAKNFSEMVITISQLARPTQEDPRFRQLPDDILKLIFEELNDSISKDPAKAMLWAVVLLNTYRYKKGAEARTIEYMGNSLII